MAKGWAEELSERGFDDTGDLAICARCVVDGDLRRDVESVLTRHECTFCGASAARDPIAADFEDFMPFVMGAVRFIYEHAGDAGVPIDDGGYWDAVHIHDSDDVIDDVCIGVFADEVEDAVLESIREVVQPQDWVDRSWGWLEPDEAMRGGWEAFRDKVRYESRFVFLIRGEEPARLDPDHVSPAEFLRRLAPMVERTGHLKEIPSGRAFWRGRMIDSPGSAAAFNAASLGAPPRERASANRMSPAGIAMFYGSDDVGTVVAEIAAHSVQRFAVVGAFETTRSMRVLDLSALPPVPSIFDRGRRNGRYDIRFLAGFADDLRSPVAIDGQEHIEYVPTQVVTEYLRWIASPKIDGILFRSAQSDGVSCAIFCDSSGCADEGMETEDTRLRLLSRTVHPVRVLPTPMAV